MKFHKNPSKNVDNLRLCMTMYDYVWLWMTMYDYVWLCMSMIYNIWLYDYVGLYTTIYAC